jgi:hypothetical protein
MERYCIPSKKWGATKLARQRTTEENDFTKGTVRKKARVYVDSFRYNRQSS